MLLFALACSSTAYDSAPLQALTEPALGSGQQAPDFELIDQNPTSASHSQLVGPNRALDRVSAWYFGHST